MTESDRIVIVEPTAHARRQAGDIVAQAGCVPICVSTAKEALTALETVWPLLILLDLKLPKGTGDACSRTIKSNQYLAEVPLVAMTARPSRDDVQRVFLAGADDFLAKPLRAFQLLSKISAVKLGHRAPFALGSGSAARAVLVASNDPFARQQIGHVLSRSGYQVLYAGSGLEVIQALSLGQPAPQLCVLDFVTLDMGWDLVAKIRKSFPADALRMVVLVKGSPPSEVSRHGRKYGVDAVLAKRTATVQSIVTRVNEELFHGKNSRSAPRKPLYSVCEFRRRPDEEWLSGFAYEASATGLGVRTLTPAPAGASIELSFGTDLGERLTTSATVAWANEFHARDAYSYPYGMGLRFEGESPTFPRALEGLMRGRRR